LLAESSFFVVNDYSMNILCHIYCFLAFGTVVFLSTFQKRVLSIKLLGKKSQKKEQAKAQEGEEQDHIFSPNHQQLRWPGDILLVAIIQ
jgi:hypothetical protein